MKRFLINCFAGGILLFVLLSAFLIVHIVRVILLQDNVCEAFKLPTDVDTVLLGDSHVGRSIVEALQFHNRCQWNAGTPIIFSRIRLYEFARVGSLKQVKTVIVNVGLHSTAGYTQEALDRFFYTHFSWVWRYVGLFPSSPISLTNTSKIIDPQIALTISGGKPSSDIPLCERTAAEHLKARQGVENNHINPAVKGSYAMSPIKMIQQDLSAMKQFCAERNIRFVVFSAPVTQEYIEMLPAWMHENMAVIQAWLRNEGFEYYDYRRVMADEFFNDLDHLRVTGAKLFTERFFKDLGLYTPALNDPISPSANEEGR